MSDQSFGVKKRQKRISKKIKKNKKGKKSRKNRKSKKQRGWTRYGSGVDANNYDPNFSIHNTRELELFPYKSREKQCVTEQQSAINLGYNYEIWIFDKKGNKLQENEEDIHYLDDLNSSHGSSLHLSELDNISQNTTNPDESLSFISNDRDSSSSDDSFMSNEYFGWKKRQRRFSKKVKKYLI